MTRTGSGMYMVADIDLKLMTGKGNIKMTISFEDMVKYVTQCEKHKMAPT